MSTIKSQYTDLCRIATTLRRLTDECDARLVQIEDAGHALSERFQDGAFAQPGADVSFDAFARQCGIEAAEQTEDEWLRSQGERATRKMDADQVEYDQWCARQSDTVPAWGDRQTDDAGYGYRR